MNPYDHAFRLQVSAERVRHLARTGKFFTLAKEQLEARAAQSSQKTEEEKTTLQPAIAKHLPESLKSFEVQGGREDWA